MKTVYDDLYNVVRNEVRDQIMLHTDDRLSSRVWANIVLEINDQLWNEVNDHVWDYVRYEIR